MQDIKPKFGRFLTVLVCGLTAAGMSVSLPSCGSRGDHDHDHENGAEAHADAHSEKERGAHGEKESGAHAGGIHMEPEDAARFGVKTADVTTGEFREAVKTAAEVLPAASDVATASSPTTGIVSLAGGVTTGVTVKAGQVVARVKGSGVSGGDVNAAAKVALDNARRELDRVTPLLADGLITKKEYNDALAAYDAAKAAYSPAAASGVVTAPKSGVVTGIVAGEGAFVNTGDPVAVISGSGRLTLRALLPVRHVSLLPVLSGVVITPHGGEGAPVDLGSYGGRLLSSASSASSDTPGYVPVYYSFDNTAPVVAGSAAEVYLLGAPRQGVITVPVSAVSEQMGENFVYLKTGEHEYEKRRVETGASNGMDVEIVSGLKPGEKVVVKGVSFVRLAEQSTVVPEGHSHNH